MPFRLSPVAILILGMFPMLAQAEDAPLPLKLDRVLRKPSGTQEGSAAFINAQHVEAKKNDQLEASGDVELRQSGQVVTADHVVYGQVSKDLLAEGKVRVEQPGLIATGPVLKLNLDTNIGEMVQPQFELSENHARGTAETMHIAGKKNYVFDNTTFTTCPAGNDDWMLYADRLDIDRTTQVGVAHSATVDFKGVPILYTPWMDFGLNSNRRSGFLSPSYGSTSMGGTELTLPYYWNIAPNYDATIAPREIAKRGMQLNNEFRYLEPGYYGTARYEVLPGDHLTNTTRSFMSLQHAQNLGGGLGLGLNVNRASDDAYFRDLSSLISGTSQVYLLRDGTLSYGIGSWRGSVEVQNFQTLQDPLNPVGTPYRSQPNITLNGQQTLGDATFNFANQYVDFRHNTMVNAERMVVNPSVSYPLLSDLGYYVTPKLGMHYTQYRMGANNTTGIPDATRTLPIFSVDSGMQFERDLPSFLGGSYTQTLEPRLFYVYIPYRDQSMLPIFDSAPAPFTFAQIFSENRFFGSDRIGDANMATMALTSRVIDDRDGVERFRLMLGERFSFTAPKVDMINPASYTYPPNTYLTPISNSNRSDILLGLGGRLSSTLSMDSLVQYNPTLAQTDMYSFSTTYKPEPGKLVNLGYRLERGILHQTDVSTQWPLFGHWLGVGSLSYSLLNKNAVEALAGVEYNQSCWTMRFVAQTFTIATNVRSSGFFLQLELNGMGAVGFDPMEALRLNVPGYTKMNSLPGQPAQGMN